MESEEQLNTYSNLVENVQCLHETQQNPICEQKMLLECMPLVLHCNAVLKSFSDYFMQHLDRCFSFCSPEEAAAKNT